MLRTISVQSLLPSVIFSATTSFPATATAMLYCFTTLRRNGRQAQYGTCEIFQRYGNMSIGSNPVPLYTTTKKAVYTSSINTYEAPKARSVLSYILSDKIITTTMLKVIRRSRKRLMRDNWGDCSLQNMFVRFPASHRRRQH